MRSFALGISLFILGLLLVVKPAQFASQVPGASALLNLVPLLLDAAKAALFQAKIFDFSVLGLLATAVVLSYHPSDCERIRNSPLASARK